MPFNKDVYNSTFARNVQPFHYETISNLIEANSVTIERLVAAMKDQIERCETVVRTGETMRIVAQNVEPVELDPTNAMDYMEQGYIFLVATAAYTVNHETYDRYRSLFPSGLSTELILDFMARIGGNNTEEPKASSKGIPLYAKIKSGKIELKGW